MYDDPLPLLIFFVLAVIVAYRMGKAAHREESYRRLHHRRPK